MGIFGTLAPQYWATGLPVIPLWPKQKRPAILDWSQFGSRMPTEDEQNSWLSVHGAGNIGLPLGPASGVVAFDVDTLDGKVIETIEEMMPVKSPWKRVGKKGYVAAFRFNGEKTFRIKDMGGQTICELLSTGTQVVLPPSIHPDTGLEYTANCGLLDVVARLPKLPLDFEKNLRAALGLKGVKLSVSGYSRLTEWVPKSSRDTKYASVCGMYASDVIKGRLTLLEAIRGVEAWPETFTEQVVGDNLDPKDGVKKLIRFLTKSVREDELVLRSGWDKGLTDEDKQSLGVDFDADEQERSYEEIMDILQSDLDVAVSMQDKMNAVHSTLERVKRSPSLTKLQEEQILKMVCHISGLKLQLATLRRELNKMRNRGLNGESHAEIAEHMKDKLGDVRFHMQQFWEWEGSFWTNKPEWELQAYVVQNYANFPVCKRNADYVAVVRTFATLSQRSLAEVATTGVNFANGFLTPDLRLHDHNPAFGMTYRLPYQYMAGHETMAPRFFAFLRDAWGHDDDYLEKIESLREAICATLFGIATKMNRAILLYGVAHSGKSVLLRIIEGLLPSDRISAIPPDSWGDKFAPAQLAGKLLNIGGELHEKKKIDGQVFKQVVAGETMPGQHKGQQIFRFYPTCAHWFASNYLPMSDDMSEGFLRRWMILSFLNKFPEDKRNVNLADDIIAEEREAIVAWAVQVMGRLQDRNCYSLPSSHETRIRDLLAGQDSIYFFLQTGQRIKVTPCPGNPGPTGSSTLTAISARDVFDEYHSFTASMAARPVLFPTFMAKMRQLAPILGFREVMLSSVSGFQETGYYGLTVLDAHTARK